MLSEHINRLIVNQNLFNIARISAAEAACYKRLISDTNRDQDPQNLEASQVAAATLLNTDLFENPTADSFARLSDEDDEIYEERVQTLKM